MACVVRRAQTFSHTITAADELGSSCFGRVCDVVLVQEPLHLDTEAVEGLLDVRVELRELEADDLAALALPHERHVDQANRVRVHQVG